MGLSPGCDLWKHLRPTMREIKWTILRAVDSLPVGNVSIASTFFNFQLVARNTRVVDCIKIRIICASMYIRVYKLQNRNIILEKSVFRNSFSKIASKTTWKISSVFFNL